MNTGTMDSLFNVNRIISSKSVNPASFLQSSAQTFILPNTPFSNDSREKGIRELMNITISDDEFKNVSQNCSPQALSGAVYDLHSSNKKTRSNVFVKRLFKPVKVTPQALRFHTVRRSQQLRDDKTYSFKTWLKYRSEKCPTDKVLSSVVPDLEPGKEILIRIRLYHPFRYIPGAKCGYNPKFFHDLVVLGSDTLDVLRDKILCANDLASHDISTDPESTIARVITKDYLKSGFLFIDGTFYNDHRDPANIDYSECIREWSKTRKNIGPFKTAVMEQTTFDQLSIRLGYPQVYQHLGNCEHLFTFSDIEMLQPSDSCVYSDYPIYKTVSVRKARYCNMCGSYVAKWKVEENERVPFDPAFFCEGCFTSYNYIDGVKIGNFKAFPYFDSVVAM